MCHSHLIYLLKKLRVFWLIYVFKIEKSYLKETTTTKKHFALQNKSESMELKFKQPYNSVENYINIKCIVKMVLAWSSLQCIYCDQLVRVASSRNEISCCFSPFPASSVILYYHEFIVSTQWHNLFTFLF